MAEHRTFEKISFHANGNVSRIAESMRALFRLDAEAIQRVKGLASEFAALMESFSPEVERYTGSVCPFCLSVCCINRHSYYEYDDIICVFAAGGALPLYRQGIADTDPCQFLGNRGCTVKRSLRPYRCTWYFCAPLLEKIGSSTAADYRRFIHSLEQLTRKREDLLVAYEEACTCIIHK